MIHRKYVVGPCCLLALGACGPQQEPGEAESTREAVVNAKAPPSDTLDCVSARAEPGEDVKAWLDACAKKSAAAEKARSTATAAPMAGSTYCSPGVGKAVNTVTQVPAADVNFAKTGFPVWNDADITTHFRYSRDVRFMRASDDPNFPRRISWLYPDDGCYARADLVAWLVPKGLPRPWKLFVFSPDSNDIVAQTNNTTSGWVRGWRYHVAPVVKSRQTGKIMVFDAALHDAGPQEYADWLTNMSTPGGLQAVLADSWAYTPESHVTCGPDSHAAAIDAEQTDLLLKHNLFMFTREGDRQLELHRDPVMVLGEYPPWGAWRRDFDYDRHVDILWHHRLGYTTAWHMNGPIQTSQDFIQPSSLLSDADGWHLVGTGDFDRDGKTDLCWHNGITGATIVWFMNGVNISLAATVGPNLMVPDTTGWAFVGTGDFNYDGTTDLVLHNDGTGQTRVWFLKGGLVDAFQTVISVGEVEPSTPMAVGQGWAFAGTGDFNRDGKVDIVWRNPGLGRTVVWYMDNLSKAGSADVDTPVYPPWVLAGTGDFDYDGQVDLLWKNAEGMITMWYLNGVSLRTWVALDPSLNVPDSSGWRPAGN